MGAAIRSRSGRTAGRAAAADARRTSWRALALLVLFAVGQAAFSIHLIRHELAQLKGDSADTCGICKIAGHMGGAPRPDAALLPVQLRQITYDDRPTAPAPAQTPALSFDSRAPPARFLA